MSKYKTQEEWGDGARMWLIVSITLAMLLIIGLGLFANERKREAEFIGHQLSIDEIRKQAEDPESYRF